MHLADADRHIEAGGIATGSRTMNFVGHRGFHTGKCLCRPRDNAPSNHDCEQQDYEEDLPPLCYSNPTIAVPATAQEQALAPALRSTPSGFQRQCRTWTQILDLF